MRQQLTNSGNHIFGVSSLNSGEDYSSDATCLTRPRLFHVFLVVSRTIIICCMIRHLKKPALDK